MGVAFILSVVLICAHVCSGEWAQWGGWSPCSATCGGGFTARMRICTAFPGSVCKAGTWDVDAGVCNRIECDDRVKPEHVENTDPNLIPDPEPILETSTFNPYDDEDFEDSKSKLQMEEWSKCEDAMQFKDICDIEGNCERKVQKCPTVGGWEEWSTCEFGWHSRERCNENFDCEWEEKECEEAISKIENGWSEWTVCGEGFETRSRERCTSKFGCEEEVEKCEEVKAINLGTWGSWGPCTNGLKSRFKCSGENHCTDEEVIECFMNVWSEWGQCMNGKQERSKCNSMSGCQTEQRTCGQSLSMNSWSSWSKCDQGFHSRTKCNVEGVNCLFEEKECEDWVGGVWSSWTECKDGTREREKCSFTECELEIQDCEDPYTSSVGWEWEVLDNRDDNHMSWEWEGDTLWDVYIL